MPKPQRAFALLIQSAATLFVFTIPASLTAQPRCSVAVHPQSVPASLASLSAKVTTLRPRVGQPIPVTLTLQAGPKGVYLPQDFQSYEEGCVSGFFVWLLTSSGGPVYTTGRGCAADRMALPTDTAQAELKNYVRLAPTEKRVWQTTMPMPEVSSRDLCLYAEFVSDGYMIDAVSKLPEVEGTMAEGRIVAAPIAIHLAR